MSVTGVGEPPMCSDWCHICNVSTLDIHSVGTQLKLLLAPQECKWDQLCVQVCKCEQQLEVVGLPVLQPLVQPLVQPLAVSRLHMN